MDLATGSSAGAEWTPCGPDDAELVGSLNAQLAEDEGAHLIGPPRLTSSGWEAGSNTAVTKLRPHVAAMTFWPTCCGATILTTATSLSGSSSYPAGIEAAGSGACSLSAPRDSSGRAGLCALTSTTATPGQEPSGRNSASHHTAGSCAGQQGTEHLSRPLIDERSLGSATRGRLTSGHVPALAC